jgi:predicted transcriptional regulator
MHCHQGDRLWCMAIYKTGISIRLTQDQHDAVQQAARERDWSLSKYIELAVMEKITREQARAEQA